MCDTRWMIRAAGAGLAGLVLAAALAPPLAAQSEPVPGFVDGSPLVDLVGDENLRLEVSISGTLMKTLTGWDPELQELIGGLRSIHAVVLDLAEGDVAEARKAVRRKQSELLGRGWERVALVREEDAEINVLVLSDGRAIQGLVVMIVDTGDEPALVFANVAGTVDLAAIQRLGEELDVPGLRDLELGERE